MKNFMKVLALGSVIAAGSPYASATLITAGQIVVPSTTTNNAAGIGNYTGTALHLVATPVATTGDPNPFVARYNELIYTGGANPFCSTCLNFVVNFQNIAPGGSTDPIERFTLTAFDSFLTDVAYIPGTGTGPGQAPVNASRGAGGNALGYQFANGGIQSPDTSDTVVIFTNAMAFMNGTITFQDGTTVDSAALVPAAVTPEPGSILLLGTGLLSSAGMLIRRRRVS